MIPLSRTYAHTPSARKGGRIASAMDVLLFTLGTLLVAGFVHLASVLLLPYVSEHHAVRLLMAGSPLNEMEVIQNDETQRAIPFADPYMQKAICPFDITQDPLRLRVYTGDTFLSLSVITGRGKIALGVTDRAATRRQLDILLATDAQIRRVESQDPDDEPVQELRLRLSDTRGVAVVRVLGGLPSDAVAVSALLDRATCRSLPL